MSSGKVWYAATGSTDGHGAITAVGHSFVDVLKELGLTVPSEVINGMVENDQNYISIQFAELAFGVPERR